jgi:hypothetical protein
VQFDHLSGASLLRFEEVQASHPRVRLVACLHPSDQDGLLGLKAVQVSHPDRSFSNPLGGNKPSKNVCGGIHPHARLFLGISFRPE